MRLQFMQAAIIAWARAGGLRPMPWRSTKDPYQLILAEILLQRTPWWKVGSVWSAILCKYPAPNSLAVASVPELQDLVRPLGLPRRAATLQRLGAVLVERHGGEVPHDYADLMDLPGVGEYVASAVRCMAFGVADAMSDSVTARVFKRVLGLSGPMDAVDKHVTKAARNATPDQPEDARIFNLALIDLAGTICLPVRPRCEKCPISEVCISVGLSYSRGSWRKHAQVATNSKK